MLEINQAAFATHYTHSQTTASSPQKIEKTKTVRPPSIFEIILAIIFLLLLFFLVVLVLVLLIRLLKRLFKRKQRYPYRRRR